MSSLREIGPWHGRGCLPPEPGNVDLNSDWLGLSTSGPGGLTGLHPPPPGLHVLRNLVGGAVSWPPGIVPQTGAFSQAPRHRTHHSRWVFTTGACARVGVAGDACQVRPW